MHYVRAWATPAATATWIVVGITGVLMFFHLAEGAVKEMHEWLGMAAFVAIALHIVKNWAPLMIYPKRGPSLYVALGLTAVVAAGFLGVGLLEGEEGKGRGGPWGLVERLEGGTLTELAPLFDTTPEALAARLTTAGLKGVSVDATPRAIAEASNTEPRDVLAALQAE